MAKRNYDDDHVPVATWLTKTELAHFKAVAIANNVTPAAYLRAMIVDVLAEEGARVSIPRKRLSPDLFERYARS
jgi:hypothetical protein